MQKEVVDLIYRLGEFKIRVGLDNTYKLMQLLGSPQLHPRIVHIAGTNGKGSVLAFLEKLLLDSGFTVGLTTSPHLLDYNERFRFQGQAISDEELESVFNEICQKCQINLKQNSKNWLVEPTFFEFSIGLAFYWFSKKKPDYILVETGMGGRLDSTNVIPSSIACAFTPISFDHSEFLGDSLLKIALEKFGIVKDKSIIISSKQEEVITDLLEKKFPAQQKYIFNKDFSVNAKNLLFKSKLPQKISQEDAKSKEWLQKWQKENEIKISLSKIPFQVDYQLDNAATALMLYFTTVANKRWLNPNQLDLSLQKSHWPARMQYIKKTNPTLLLDAAHNIQGMEVLKNHLTKYHLKDKIICAIHWLAKKDIRPILAEFKDLNIDFIPIIFEHSKANTIDNIHKDLKEGIGKSLHPQSLETLIQNFLGKKFADYSIFLVTGSIYFLAAFYAELTNRSQLFTKKMLYGV